MLQNQIKGDVIDYHEVPYQKVHFKLDEGHKKDLVFTKDAIQYLDNQIMYNEITKVNVSMCSRLYNPGVVSKGPVDFIVKSWKQGVPLTAGPIHVIYSMDLDIIVGETHYMFESYNLDDADKVLDLFQQHNIVVNDSVGVFKIVKDYPDHMKRQKYLDANFKNLANQYHLDNPRGVVFINNEELLSKSDDV